MLTTQILTNKDNYQFSELYWNVSRLCTVLVQILESNEIEMKLLLQRSDLQTLYQHCICVQRMYICKAYAYVYSVCICVRRMYMCTAYAYVYSVCICVRCICMVYASVFIAKKNDEMFKQTHIND